jgi:AcrR family transcriptional regulator
MLEKGCDKATMAEIATAAGCATGTFYLYFKNKQELLAAIVARHTQAMFAAVDAVLFVANDPLSQLRAVTDVMLRYIHKHKDFFRIFFTAMPLRHRAMHQQLDLDARRRHELHHRRILEVIRAAQKLGQIRGDLPAELVQEFIMNSHMGLVEYFVFATKPPSFAQQVRILWGLTLDGIRGPKEGGKHEKA